MKIILMINILNNQTESLTPPYTTIPHDTSCTSQLLVRSLHSSHSPASPTLATDHSIHVVGSNNHSNTTWSKIPIHTCGSELYKLKKHKKCILKTTPNETFTNDKYKNVLKVIRMSVMLITVVLFLVYLL